MIGRNGTDILSKINWMRIYMKGGATTDNSSIVTGIDDIRFTNDLPGKVLSDLDSGAGCGLAALTNGEVTTNADYVKEGSGALLNTSGTQELFRFTMMPVNIADYTNGYLHFWLYISNTSAWNGTVIVELTSSGVPDTNELQWNLDKSTLQNGWNEVERALSDPSSRKGTINFSAVNFLRIFQASGAASAALTVALDDLRVCPYDSYSKADLRFVTSVDDLNYQKVGYNIMIGSVTKNVSSNTVYQKLYAVDSDSTVLSYHPYDACHGMSNYFYTYSIWNIPADAFSTAITVQPYWVTLDGTTVYGAAVERSVNTILGK